MKRHKHQHTLFSVRGSPFYEWSCQPQPCILGTCREVSPPVCSLAQSSAERHDWALCAGTWVGQESLCRHSCCQQLLPGMDQFFLKCNNSHITCTGNANHLESNSRSLLVPSPCLCPHSPILHLVYRLTNRLLDFCNNLLNCFRYCAAVSSICSLLTIVWPALFTILAIVKLMSKMAKTCYLILLQSCLSFPCLSFFKLEIEILALYAAKSITGPTNKWKKK